MPRTKTDTQDFRHFILDQLKDLAELYCRAMFGGHGLYQGEIFFGVIHQGKLYFKTNALTQGSYQAYNMTPFSPNAKQTLKHYYQVPIDILENSDLLCIWAKQAISVAQENV